MTPCEAKEELLMKHCSRRLMALLLSAILCVQLLPAMVRAEEGTAAASEGKIGRAHV